MFLGGNFPVLTGRMRNDLLRKKPALSPCLSLLGEIGKVFLNMDNERCRELSECLILYETFLIPMCYGGKYFCPSLRNITLAAVMLSNMTLCCQASYQYAWCPFQDSVCCCPRYMPSVRGNHPI